MTPASGRSRPICPERAGARPGGGDPSDHVARVARQIAHARLRIRRPAAPCMEGHHQGTHAGARTPLVGNDRPLAIGGIYRQQDGAGPPAPARHRGSERAPPDSPRLARTRRSCPAAAASNGPAWHWRRSCPGRRGEQAASRQRVRCGSPRERQRAAHRDLGQHDDIDGPVAHGHRAPVSAKASVFASTDPRSSARQGWPLSPPPRPTIPATKGRIG